MIAGEWFPICAGCARERRSGAKAIAVRIAGQNQIGADLFGALDDDVEYRRVFRIRHVARHIRKIAVWFRVRPEKFDIGKAIGRKRRHNRRGANAMQRRIDDFQIARPGQSLIMHALDKRRVDFLLTVNNLARRQRFAERRAANLIDIHHPIDNRLVVRRQHLHAAGPINFHRIVAGRIVAGRDHDAARRIRVPHRKRQLRRAAEAVEKINLKPRRDHDLRTQLGKCRELCRVS